MVIWEDTITTNFERVKNALDRLLPRVVVKNPETLDVRIGKRCARLRRSYSGNLLAADREPIDYSRPVTQLAYIYRSLPAHAEWVFKALMRAPRTVGAVFNRSEVKIACIGGGPGSDILGIVKFAESQGFGKRQLSFTVLDRERGWNVARNDLVAAIASMPITQRYQHLDLAERGSWTDEWGFVSSDILTFSFSLSEVWSYNDAGSVSEFLDRVISNARKGALFVYVDNGGDNFSPLVDAEFSDRDDIKCLASVDDDEMRLGADEQRAVLEDAYMKRFGGERTKMGGNVAMRVWAKQ